MCVCARPQNSMRVSRYKNPVIGRLVLVLLSPRPWEQKNREIVVAFYVRRRASGALCYTKQFQVPHTHTHTRRVGIEICPIYSSIRRAQGGGVSYIFPGNAQLHRSSADCHRRGRKFIRTKCRRPTPHHYRSMYLY